MHLAVYVMTGISCGVTTSKPCCPHSAYLVHEQQTEYSSGLLCFVFVSRDEFFWLQLEHVCTTGDDVGFERTEVRRCSVKTILKRGATWLHAFLAHSRHQVPWYRGSAWSYMRGGLSTRDHDYGIFNNIHHDIGTHVVHHLFPQVRSREFTPPPC